MWSSKLGAPLHLVPLALIHLDAVMKLYRCVVEIKLKDKFEDGCGPTHDY